MKPLCVILDDYQGVALQLADWSKVEAQYEVRALQNHIGNEDQLIKILNMAEIIFVMRERTPLTKNLLSQCSKLKLIVTSGMRNASIDLEYAKQKGIKVFGTSSGSEPPAELTWALILGWIKRITDQNIHVNQSPRWQTKITQDLYGRNLGIMGLGKIGQKVAKVGQAFGMKVSALSKNLDRDLATRMDVYPCQSKAELLETSDILTLHLVLSERTHHILDKNDFNLMKQHCLLVNTSRAGLVETSALIDALQTGKIAGACVDVFDQEPLPIDSPLRSLNNLIGTPHLGYVSEHNYKKYFLEGVENINVFMENGSIRSLY